MKNCTDAREQLTLRLYDELEERENTALQAHLEDCVACRAFSDELGQGLGRLAADTREDLPVGWAAQLHARVGTETSARTVRARHNPRRAAGLGLAAGFLLGLAGTALFALGDALLFTPEQAYVIEADLEVKAGEDDWLAIQGGDDATEAIVEHRREFRRATPAPLALAGGDLSRLQAYLRR